MKLHCTTLVILIIGGLNWVLFMFGWDIAQFVPAIVAQVIYILVGLSALYQIVTMSKGCKQCNPGAGMSA